MCGFLVATVVAHILLLVVLHYQSKAFDERHAKRNAEYNEQCAKRNAEFDAQCKERANAFDVQERARSAEFDEMARKRWADWGVNGGTHEHSCHSEGR